MKVLITGGTGFIGYHLAKKHVQIGDSVIIIDNMFKNDGKVDTEIETLLKQDNIEFINIDLTMPISDCLLPKDLDIIYHLAAINGTELFYKLPYMVAKTNISMTLRLLDYFEKQHSVKKIVFSSTSEVYAGAYAMGHINIPTDETALIAFTQPTDSRFSYASSKFMSEFLFMEFSKKFEIPTSIIRYHNIYGPRMGMRHVIPELVTRLNNGESPLKVYGADETRSFCFISDAVDATISVANSDNTNQEIIHIGDQNGEIAINLLAKKIIDLMGLDVALEKMVGRPNSVSRRCPDTRKLFAKTGFKAKVGITDGLSKTIKWYLRN
jgi:nucleoside-diphosphate-sugar epimerase